MKTIKCNAGKPYSILVGRKLIENSGRLIRQYAANGADKAARAIIISDSNVWPIWGGKTGLSLKNAGFEVSHFCFDAGEKQKNMQTIELILKQLSQNSITRGDIVVALGGGVVGDMAGFAAAIWLRGINFVQIPTSLLSQVDSSVGGKTGIDTEYGKNLVGCFHQPSLVICDTDTLNTLPTEYFYDGMGEVIKYGCILDRDLFDMLEGTDAKHINSIIDDVTARCITIKADIVMRDEYETGIRALLNFGHTLGHAAERLYNFRLSHGRAVAIGMMYVTLAGECMGLTAPGSSMRLERLLNKFNLPTKQDDFSLRQLCDACGNDKKRMGDDIKLIMLGGIGKAFIKTVKCSQLYDDVIINAQDLAQ